MNNLINLIILGEQKCGTTSLKYNLNKHPDINIIMREMHIFDTNRPTNLYRQFIDNSKIYNGEGTPIYFYQKNCINKLLNYNNEIRYLVILRDPVKRFISSHNMFKRKKIENRSINQCVVDEINSYNNNENLSTKFVDGANKHYLRRGFYIDQIKYLLKFIKRENIHIIISEFIWSNKDVELQKIWEFLNLKNCNLDYEVKHSRKYYDNDIISIDLENRLKNIYSSKNKELEEFLSIKLPW